MSAPAVVDRTAFAAQAQSRAVRRVQRSVTSAVVIIGAGFWVVYAVVAVVVPLIVRNAGNQMDAGVLSAADYIARWVAFGTTVAMFATILRPHLAAGGTRGALRTGAVRAAAITGLVYGLLKSLALLGERAYFGALGWPWQRLDGGPRELTDLGDFALTALAEAVVTAVYLLVGCAVVAGYQTHGVWRGTALLLPGIALLALVELATLSGSTADLLGHLVTVDGAAAAGRLLAGLAVVALAAAWLHLRLRNLRLRPTR
ncbi:hypothetical protein MWU57_07865 [Isoptericola sp. S6320L]|uniref:hypothetical protein n=1 Tax=Isoptericola sp. S6320L TaxID=2926411 RepID=UPI001FF528D7|nr:hypothetical protein [Isoptericola sp. S6320L]MCK0116949.1 hypothetical protein [Isoptericola sp. S6320L]